MESGDAIQVLDESVEYATVRWLGGALRFPNAMDLTLDCGHICIDFGSIGDLSNTC